ncbi:MAG: hypothetical protein SNF68_04455 [Rikenellaceae bacterium]
MKNEVLELAKRVATENPPKNSIEKYLDKRAKRAEEEARSKDQLLTYCGLKKR